MNILDAIIQNKRIEVANAKEKTTTHQLESSPLFERDTHSLVTSLTSPHTSGIIAEFKRKSPSKGLINDNVDISNVTQGYVDAGASALSILTDKHYFGGNEWDLKTGRQKNSRPILRKDFIIDEYQVLEAKAWGADVLLLIAAVLSPKEVKHFSKLAQELGLEVLLEIHNIEELNTTLCENIQLVGVNNRDLKSFTTNINVSKKLAASIPDDVVKISESGISNVQNIKTLQSFGYKGFLIGEIFMQSPTPAIACKRFIEELKKS